MRKGHLAVDIDVIALEVDARLDEEVSVRLDERASDVEHAPTFLHHLAYIHGVRDIGLEDLWSIRGVWELCEHLVKTIRELAWGSTGQREGNFAAEAADMLVDVLENEGSGVARGAVHDERERSFFFFDRLSEMQPEKLSQLSLLQGLPVLLHQVAVSLEKVLAQSILDDVGLHERVEEFVGNVHALIARYFE